MAWLLALATVGFVVGVADPSVLPVGVGMDLLLLLAALVDGRRAARAPLTGRRALPERVHQHEAFELRLVLSTSASGPHIVRFRDPLHGHLAAQPAPESEHLVFPAGFEHVLAVVPEVRGEALLQPVVVRVRGPLGLVWHQRVLPDTRNDVVRVLPQRALEGDDGRFVRRVLTGRPGAHLRHSAGASPDLAHLREYHPGDSRRSIHWRASARRHRPVTRVTREAHQSHVVLLVDAGRTMAAECGWGSRLDRVLAAVLAYARVVVHRQDRASVVVYDTNIRQVVHLDPRLRSFRAAYDTLASLQPTSATSDPGVAASWVQQHARRGMKVVFCTVLTDPSNTERLVAAVGLCARRFPTVLLQLHDPTLERTARSLPDTLEAAYEKASAMARRERLADLSKGLRSTGAAVVKAPADRLVVSLVHRLEWQRRG